MPYGFCGAPFGGSMGCPMGADCAPYGYCGCSLCALWVLMMDALWVPTGCPMGAVGYPMGADCAPYGCCGAQALCPPCPPSAPSPSRPPWPSPSISCCRCRGSSPCWPSTPGARRYGGVPMGCPWGAQDGFRVPMGCPGWDMGCLGWIYGAYGVPRMGYGVPRMDLGCLWGAQDGIWGAQYGYRVPIGYPG